MAKAKKPIPRRAFLKTMLGLPTSVAFASYLDLFRKMRSALEKNGIISSDLTDKEKADILGWNLLDWRDLSSARGIVKARRLYGEEWENEAVMFQGAGHNGTREYLRDPNLRLAKSAFYLNYGITGDNRVRRFRFNKSLNEWQLVESSPY